MGLNSNFNINLYHKISAGSESFFQIEFRRFFTGNSNYSKRSLENPIISMSLNPILKKIEGQIKNRAPSDCCKFILVLYNHICLNENVNPRL